ncbi:MAG: hypothetical protein ACRDRT_18310, partial [Pseudonocardiaceae bacterium]
GESLRLDDGTRAFVGDHVATRRNDSHIVTNTGSPVCNRQTWTVAQIGDDKSLTLFDPKRGRVQLPATYAARHVELGWAVTGYGNQGVTTGHGICVVEPSSSRAGIYVAMTRGRGHNLAWVVDKTGDADAQEAFASAISRPANSITAHAMRARLGSEPPVPVLKLVDAPTHAADEAPPELDLDDAVAHALRMIRRLNQPSTRKPPVRGLRR